LEGSALPPTAIRFESSTGAAIDLTPALDVPGTNIVHAIRLNHANEIVAIAMIDGVSGGVLLTP
jgi:hypothetical protein